jgi:cyclophilin family peptidyl-prolyl cis-trans isomerase
VEAAAAAIPTPGCRHVPPPPSRAGEEVPKPTTTLNPAHSYTVTLTTNCGPIAIQLAVKEAPKIASTFAYLVGKGYYNQLTFHRIVPGFVVQGGDPNGNGSGGPSWQVVEAPPHNLRYTQGTVAMAKTPSAPSGAAGSQFFIVTGPSVNLPPEYALVGHVTAGEKNVEAIARVPTESERPRVPVVIEKAALVVH